MLGQQPIGLAAIIPKNAISRAVTEIIPCSLR
jgi:hypothetical protein